MKNLLLVLLCLPLFLFAQEEKKANMYEVINMKVKRGQEDGFEAAIKAHNEQFHNDGDYRAFLMYNVNGPLGGHYSWVMGPTNWAAMDNRPGEGAHDDDWENVDQHVASYSSPGYWNMSDKLSHIARDEGYSKRLIWMYDIRPGKYARFSELIGKVKEVYKEKRPEESYWVVWNQFANSDKGWDVALIFGMDKWAEMDENSAFGPMFEEIHGPGTWHTFLNEFNDTVDGRIDWIRHVVD
ncbi:MAG TPA: hypothetical protein VJ917_10450 [Saprospiraceae bacterium]|nr:hypothetical protein [Saprospiraceae bacterium]